MFTNSILVEKTFVFSLKIINIAHTIKVHFQEYELASQLVRSATSIGANITEAKVGSSRKDYFAKLKIARKEYYETLYWLELLNRSNLISQIEYEELVHHLANIGKLIHSWLAKEKTNC